jgi:O-antigen ligase
MAVQGIVQYNTGVGLGGTTSVMSQKRITGLGIFNDPNDLAMTLSCTIPFCVYLFSLTKNHLLKLFYITSALALVYGIFLTNSRGGILSLGGSLGYILFRKFKNKLLAVIVGTLVLTLFIAFGPSRMSELNSQEESANDRIESWYVGVDLFKQNPLLGVGYGMFTEYHHLTAHNSFVLAFSELGIIGFICWLALFYFSARNLLIIDISKKELSNLALIFESCFLSILMSIFFLSRTYNILLYIFFALSVSIYREHLLTFKNDINYICINDILIVTTVATTFVAGIFLITRVCL